MNNKLNKKNKPTLGLTLNIKAKDFYKFPDKFFPESGKLFFPSYSFVHSAVKKMNDKRDIISNPEKTVKSGELNSLTLITDAIQILIYKYERDLIPNVFKELYSFLKDQVGEYHLEKLFEEYKKDFYINEKKIKEDVKSLFLREIILTWLTNKNPAFSSYKDLFDDEPLKKNSVYSKITESLNDFFSKKPFFDEKEENLIEFLRKPAVLYHDSIQKQLEYIKENWGKYLGDFLNRILSGMDLLKEEQKIGFGGPGPSQIYQFNFDEEEYEKFTRDSEWMPHLVLIAKSTYVWLDQLSKKYKREIKFLDQIPDEELVLLSNRGFTGLWFIGLWERSKASQKCKHLTGNTEAIASAYSLAEYRVADALGGEEAMKNLQYRAWKFGIRIACDMVPNHTGVDSDWIVDHPEWFMQLSYPPFPSYTFTKENISGREEIEVYLEDHYFDKSDAAVVFKLYDRRNNSTRFIYHGNDGTSIPWNDTAQLNYLLPEVREAVIRNIINIAKKFPVIRFDAAMTLAKKHIQRLWFPLPGTGGDIPSRAEFGLTKAEFNQHMPKEFWREVVDRVAVEAPNTLLLAEAFWMMEGYFVRTLGMHRVYNSAFMNMLKDEDNAKYRKSIYNIIEFNPEILKRFVNFMSNPDEETALAQFGKEDKYFGVCILMATMPGLPMFAHGQVEGFSERYGMEFSRAKWDESEDKHLVERHKKEIFPILKKRILFSEVQNFLLYDFETDSGYLNENVFAYSNENLNELSLVVYNNKYEFTTGRILWANTVKKDNKKWLRKNLGNALHLHNDSSHYVIFQDVIKGMQFIRNSKEIFDNGIHQELGAFKYSVFMNFREVEDDQEQKYKKLTQFLQGKGVPNLEISIKRLELKPLLDKFSAMVDSEVITLMEKLRQSDIKDYELNFKPEMEFRITDFLKELNEHIHGNGEIELITKEILEDISTWLGMFPKSTLRTSSQDTLTQAENYIILYWILIYRLGELIDDEKPLLTSSLWLDELLLGEEIQSNYNKLVGDKFQKNIVSLLKIAIRFCNFGIDLNTKNYTKILKQLFNDIEIQDFLLFNKFEDKLWFNKEAFDQLFPILHIVNLIFLKSDKFINKKDLKKKITELDTFFKSVQKAENESDYEVKKILDLS